MFYIVFREQTRSVLVKLPAYVQGGPRVALPYKNLVYSLGDKTEKKMFKDLFDQQ